MSYNWNEHKCMSSKNIKSDERCHQTKIYNSDFCKYHVKSRNYNNILLNNIRKNNLNNLNNLNINIRKITFELKKMSTQVILNEIINNIKHKINNSTNTLNNEHVYKLMSLKDNWDIVPYFNRINISDGWWDIQILINHITSQLNKSEMENPYPVYPSSPFTRVQYTINDVYKIRDLTMKLNIPINIALKYFLLAPHNKHKKFNCESRYTFTNFSDTLLNYFRNHMRFRLMNNKNSQSCFTGVWVNNNEGKNYFENLYERLNCTQIEVYLPGMGYAINGDRELILTLMDSIDEDDWGPSNDYTIEFIK